LCGWSVELRWGRCCVAGGSTDSPAAEARFVRRLLDPMRAVGILVAVAALTAGEGQAQAAPDRGWIDRCIGDSLCATVLKAGQGPAAELRTEMDSLREVALRTAAALSLLESGTRGRPTMCAGLGQPRRATPADSQVVAAVRADPLHVVAMSRCRVRGSGMEWHWVAGRANHAAWLIYADVRTVAPDEASASLGYSALALMSAQWACRMKRQQGVWRIVACAFSGGS
jgi:hypothetical protein